MGDWSPYSREWEEAHLKQLATKAFKETMEEMEAYSQKPRIAQILYSLRARFHSFRGETAFKLRLAFDPKFRDAVESFKRNARVKVIKITADENGEPTVSIVDRVPATPKERGESEGNFQRTTDSRINKGKWK